MQFEELGASLQSLRRLKGLELDDIARNIKLSVRTLTSIEAGKTDELPHTVYAKGFVRTYAKYLGMPEEELNAALLEAFPVDENEVNAPPVALYTQQRKSSKLGTIIVLFFLALLALGAWYVYSNVISKNQDPPAAPATNTSSQSTAPAQANSSTMLAGQDNPASNSTQSLLEKNFGAGATLEASPTDGAISAEAANPEPTDNIPVANNSDVEGAVFFDSSAQDQSTGGRAAVKKFRVVVTATQECWLKATTDSGDERQFNLPKNQSSVFTFDKFLKLRLGNAAGVKIRYNGRDFPIPADRGNTRDLVFPPPDQASQ